MSVCQDWRAPATSAVPNYDDIVSSAAKGSPDRSLIGGAGEIAPGTLGAEIEVRTTMLRYPLTHPEIIGALAGAGHGSQILVMDGNYPHSTGSNPAAAVVHLNLRPGLPLVTDVLETLLTAVPVEAAAVMAPDEGGDPPLLGEFATLLGPEVPIARLARRDFYEAGRGRDVALAIATGEQRWYANLLLTIGALAG